MFCDDLEGWDEGWGGGQAQDEGHVCIHMADSQCRAETNTTL